MLNVIKEITFKLLLLIIKHEKHHTTRNNFCRTRSLSNVTFSFLITWRSSSSESAAVYKISWTEMIFYRDMAIYRFPKWQPSAILELFYHHTRPPMKSLLLAAAACQISCQSDTQIWRYSYLILRIFGLKCLFRPPKWEFWGLWTPKCDYSLSRPPKGTSLHKSASFKLSTVKIRWGVWPVGELTESVTDTHPHTGKFIFCPCIA